MTTEKVPEEADEIALFKAAANALLACLDDDTKVAEMLLGQLNSVQLVEVSMAAWELSAIARDVRLHLMVARHDL